MKPHRLERLFSKQTRRIVGLMSGTSADGIDTALIRVHGSGTDLTWKLEAFRFYSYPKGFSSFLLKNSHPATARLDDLTRLDMLIARFFADAVNKLLRQSGGSANKIDLIGSHGQTVQHLPQPKSLFGKSVRSTLQIGSPSAIAKLTGIVTVGNFRTGDVAVGGSGAPLVPLVDYLLLRSNTLNRAALNIGGIANITLLPRRCSLDDVRAFDTGPGNILIDALMKRFYHKPFDNDGAVASRGKLLPSLLQWLIKHPYLNEKPPKSTGREMFGTEFLSALLRHANGAQREDLITTVTEFTALSIYDQYLRFIRPKVRLDELFVSGGGARNATLMHSLRKYFDGVSIRLSDDVHLPVDAKEAICFALLANETISSNPGNVPGATGARRSTILGEIALP